VANQENPLKPDPFRRLEEYAIVLQHTDQVSLRRQNMNTVFISINAVFLTGFITGIGALLLVPQFSSWAVVLALAAASCTLVPLNRIWQNSVHLYNSHIGVNYDYLREIEEEFDGIDGVSAQNSKQAGLLRRLRSRFQTTESTRHIDERLVRYFVWLYPVITLAAIFWALVGMRIGAHA
jgi:hypothetical protein